MSGNHKTGGTRRSPAAEAQMKKRRSREAYERRQTDRRKLEKLGLDANGPASSRGHGYKGWNTREYYSAPLHRRYAISDGTMIAPGLCTRPVVVIDCDRHTAEVDGLANFDELGLDLPETFTDLTPRNGAHFFYFQNPHCQIKTSHSLLADGVDIKAAGSMAQFYHRVVDWSVLVAEVPLKTARRINELCEANRKRSNTTPVIERAADANGYLDHNVDGLIHTLRNAPNGQRHDVLVFVLNRLAEVKPIRRKYGLRMVRQVWNHPDELNKSKDAAELETSIRSILGGTSRG